MARRSSEGFPLRLVRKKRRRLPTLYSDQCEYRRRLEGCRKEVWGGKPPRGLTKAAILFSLRATPPGVLR